MKQFNFHTLLLAAGIAIFSSCSKEEKPVSSPDLGLPAAFSPPSDAPQIVKDIFAKYGVWIRMDFKEVREVTNAYLEVDVNNRWGATKIDDNQRSSAELYTKTLLSNIPEAYVKKFFPLELFYVKTYGGGFFASNLKKLGRSRLIICWPNKTSSRPITDPENHYYMDTLLTRAVWSELGSMIGDRIPEPIQEVVEAGKAYDNGQAWDKATADWQVDRNTVKRDSIRNVIAVTGGHISGSGSRNFYVDFFQWIAVLTTESHDNIKRLYLNNSPARAKKYAALIKYFNEQGWDIQATGNLYRQKIK